MRWFRAWARRHTKFGCAPVCREGIIPLLQMHDALECSVTSREQGEMIARLGEEAVKLNVPMKVDLKFGRTWGDARTQLGRTDRRKPRPQSRHLNRRPSLRDR